MTVDAAQIVDVQRHFRVIDKAAKKLTEQIDIEGADLCAGKRHVQFETGTTGEIDNDTRQRLIERHIGVAVTGHALFVADGFIDSLTERNTDIFDRVVRIDMQVALGFDVDIDQAVAGDLINHVIEERYAGVETRFTAAIEIDGYGDLRLQRVAGDSGGTCGHGRKAR